MHERVLVLGNDDRSLLATVRSLGRRGFEVHVADCPESCNALRSRYVRRAHALPAIKGEGDGVEWLDAMGALLRRHDFDLVVPCTDTSILPLAAGRAELSRWTRLYLLDDETQTIVNDKARSAELAREVGVPVAHGLRLERGDDPARALAFLKLPLVLKPLSSFVLGDLGHRRRVRRAFDRAEFLRLATSMLAEGDVVVQESFIGVGAGVEILADDGEILAAFQHVRVHEPMFGGGSSYRKSVALDPALYEATRKLVARLRYTGVGMFEYKQDPSGAFVFIEINGRFWGSLPLAVAAGADFPAWLYDLLVHQRRHFPRDYRVGLFARNTQKDFDWLRENLRADKRDKRSPVLAALPLSVVAAETLNLLTRRECNDTLVGDDPAPGLKDLADIAAYAGRAAARIARRTFFSAALSLRIAEEQVRRRLQGARRVLFVCKGNICRSPFAEAVARRAWRGVEVASAGYYPERGRASPASAVAVAGELGIDLLSHRSRILDQTMLSAADVVLVFDEENVETVERRFPYARSKLFRLGALDRAVPGGTIADPYGGTEEAFRVTYEQIHRAIDAATGIFAEAPRPARVVPMSGALED